MIRRKEPTRLPRLMVEKSEIDSVLKQMQLLVKCYFEECSVCNKANRVGYHNRFYGLNGFLEQNLMEVGTAFNVTRERVRQIIYENNFNLFKLLYGDLVLTPRVVYDIELTNHMRDFFSSIEKVDLFAHHELVHLLKPENPTEESLIYPLVGIVGFVKNEHNGVALYRRKKLTMQRIRALTLKIDHFLRKEILPTPLEKISSKIRRPEYLVRSLLGLMPYVVSKDENYYIHDQSLYFTKDLIYRIFHERNTELSLTEIRNELETRGVTPPENLSLSLDQRFKCVGKTGIWGLKEWHIDTAHVYEVMLEALRFLGKPVSINQLISCIRSRRPEIKKVTIYNYFNHYKHLFCFYEGGLIAPAEDKDKYKHLKLRTDRSKKRLASQEEVDRILIDYLKKNNKATAKKLYEEVKRHFPYSWNGFYIRLSKSKRITYDRNIDEFPRKYMINHNVLEEEKEAKQLKSDLVKKEITDILEKTKGFSMPLPKLIKMVKTKTGFQKVLIYKVVSNSPEFITKTSRHDWRAKDIKLVV